MGVQMNRDFQQSGTLQFLLPEESPQVFLVEKNLLTIGRAADNDFAVDHASISRHHARLICENGRWYVEDLNSSNGTFLNNQRLKPLVRQELHPGIKLHFGSIEAVANFLPASSVADGEKTIIGRSENQSTLLAQLLSTPKKRRLLGIALLSGACLTALLCITVVLAAGKLGIFGEQRKTLISACAQPAMPVTQRGGQIFTISAAQTAVPGFTPVPSAVTITQTVQTPTLLPTLPGGTVIYPTLNPNQGPSGLSSVPLQPLLNTAFLEIPFPFDGGNQNFGGTDDQFRTASQRNLGSNHGRINSFFDHWSPLYPAPKDPGGLGGKESPDEPVAKHIMVYWGDNDPYLNYSGHPAMDFSTFVYMQPTTPVFAAADGVIEFVGIHKASGAYNIKIKHTVAGVGDFETIYWHLNPDEYFDHMAGTEGQSIKAGTRIATMGNTGYSTGHHLHFEVRFDLNHDGQFSPSEVVDPYGWLGSAETPNDPWTAASGMVSNYLWKHPLGTTSQVPANGGGSVSQPGGSGGEFPSQQICLPPGSLPPGGTVTFSWKPDPAPQGAYVGANNACTLNVKDAQGQPVTKFNTPVSIIIPFKDQDIENIDPKTLTIYWRDTANGPWTPLPTTLDLQKKVAEAETDRPGSCALMGQPTKDIAPPAAAIQVNADRAPDGSFYDQATVTLSAYDPSGIKAIYYSLDGGQTWLEYKQPFKIDPSGIPQSAPQEAESFGGHPGNFLVVAYAVDKAGNVQNPPSYEYFSIDPSKKPDTALFSTKTANFTATIPLPQAPSATETATFTPSPTSSPAGTPTPTTLVCNPTLTLDKNAFCRKGPSMVYTPYTAFTKDTTLSVIGQNSDFGSLWLLVKVPGEITTCWVSVSGGTLTGAEGVCTPPKFKAPPLPSATPTPTWTPTPTPTPTETDIPGEGN